MHNLNIQGDSGGPFTYKQGDQHILIGVDSFASGPPVDIQNINLVQFASHHKKNCGKDTGFCKVSEVREWLDSYLKLAHHCYSGLDAG